MSLGMSSIKLVEVPKLRDVFGAECMLSVEWVVERF